jgi:hypothetical protein
VSDGDDTDPVAVELTPQEWDVVIHALEEEMAQLVPPEGNWLGKYPGEEDAVAIGDVHEKISRSMDTEGDRSDE